MSVDYFNCGICNIISNDCCPHSRCQKCGAFICDDCMTDQITKYGDESDEHYECDACSPDTIDQRIVKCQQELVDLMLERMALEQTVIVGGE